MPSNVFTHDADTRTSRAVRAGLVAAAALAVWGIAVSAQRRPPVASSASLDLVVLDVVVTDNKGNPVPGLTVDDFHVKEDGQVMEIKTFSRVQAHGSGRSDDGRTVAMLLDDTGIPPLGSTAIQQLSKAVLSLAIRGDEVSVVRLNSNDEAYGDVTEALDRVEAYRGGARPFVLSEAQAGALNRIAAMADQLSVTEGRRKAIVCIGSQMVCDVAEPGNDSRQEVWSAWQRAITATARANVAVYAIIPGRVRMRGGGIADATGGETYASFSDFREPIVTLWNDSSAHYMLGYWPGDKLRALHAISVSVARPKTHVRVRHLRGE